MYTELTNLLPLDQRKAFRREYFIRLATIGVVLLIGIGIAQCFLLLPSFLYERQVVIARTQQLVHLSSGLGTTQEQQVQSTEQALGSESTYLLTTGETPTASTALRAVLAVSRPGITLSGFTFGPGNDPTSSTRVMEISGTADTREDLRSYDSALGALPFVTSADLPISDYAKENAIPFTITLTGSFLP